VQRKGRERGSFALDLARLQLIHAGHSPVCSPECQYDEKDQDEEDQDLELDPRAE
jgi:hypothetical protein